MTDIREDREAAVNLLRAYSKEAPESEYGAGGEVTMCNALICAGVSHNLYFQVLVSFKFRMACDSMDSSAANRIPYVHAFQRFANFTDK